MKRLFYFFTFLASLFLVLSLAGCWNPFKPHTDDGDDKHIITELLPRTTPQNVLSNLKLIYGTMDDNLNTPEDAHNLALKYRELFHPEFKFYFLPGDQPAIAPEGWWGRDDEVAGFDTLMTKRALGIVSQVQLSWSPAAAVPDNRVDPNPPFPLLHPDWLWVHVTSVLLDVVEGVNTLRVPSGVADFYFAPDPADSTLWVITEWFDRETP